MKVHVTDVFLRDGLQDEDVFVSTRDKLSIAQELEDCGLTRIEVTSFVNPKTVPQMADADELFSARPANSRAVWTALTLNARGIDRAAAAGADEIMVVTSASDSHSKANAGGSTRQMLENLAPAIQRAGATPVAGISTAFTCPFEGNISPEKLIAVIEPFVDLGITTIGLADTLGNTEPERLMDSVAAAQETFHGVTWSLHLHNAHGRALETVSLALDQNIRHFDAALGGFGGCPFAPGAAGNLSTDELVRHLHALGMETGIDLPRLERLSEHARSIVSAAPALSTT